MRILKESKHLLYGGYRIYRQIRKFGSSEREISLSLFMQYYETLFGDIVATGERARSANTYSAVDVEGGEEFTEDVGDDGQEGSGDSENNNMQSPPPPNLFPSASFKYSKSSGSKKKRTGAEYVREGLENLAAAMSSRSTQSTAAQVKTNNEDAALNAAFDILNNMDQLIPGTDLYFYAGQVFLRDKVNRAFFLKAPNNEIRFGQIVYAFKSAGHQLGGH